MVARLPLPAIAAIGGSQAQGAQRQADTLCQTILLAGIQPAQLQTATTQISNQAASARRGGQNTAGGQACLFLAA